MSRSDFFKVQLDRLSRVFIRCPARPSASPRSPSALFVADWVAQKTGIPGGVIGLAFGFGAIWVVDRIDDGSLPKILKNLLLRWVQK